MELLKNKKIEDNTSKATLNTKAIEIYEKGDITILEETVKNDVYSPRLIYYKTIIFIDNDSGEKYRIKQKIQRMKKITRPELKRFGEAIKVNADENRGLTTFGEEVFMEAPGYHAKTKNKSKDVVSVKVTCRNCKGPHWTHECTVTLNKSSRNSLTNSSHYVPPTMRRDAEEKRVTVKISNLPEDTDRDVLKDMFKSCGRIYRVNVPLDRKTGAGRGFAFIDFNDKEGAISAVVMMNGQRIGYQVISVEFALNKEGKKVPIVIDDAARSKAKMQFSHTKEAESKREDVYHPSPRRFEKSDKFVEKRKINFSRGSMVSIFQNKSNPGEEGWQPRSISEKPKTFSLASKRSTPSFGKKYGNGWGDRYKGK